MRIKRIGLVSCGKEKCGYPAPAEHLYTSSLFRKASAYATKTYDAWFVLSAKYGLLDPGRVVAPYDVTLNAMKVVERTMWSASVCDQIYALSSLANGVGTAPEFYIHAGARYREFLVPNLQHHGYVVHVPLLGLSIGQQLQWYVGRGF